MKKPLESLIKEYLEAHPGKVLYFTLDEDLRDSYPDRIEIGELSPRNGGSWVPLLHVHDSELARGIRALWAETEDMKDRF